MEVSGDKKSAGIPFDIIPLFFHIVCELVQALAIIYDEIFQALAAEGDVLLPKPFLDFLQPRLGPRRLSRVWQTGKKKHFRCR
jgi:hypothetical protein